MRSLPRRAWTERWSAPAMTTRGGVARLNLRMPHALKQRVEEASNAESLSLNAWLLRAAVASLSGTSHPRRRSPICW